jgi:recombinational DNA repair protein RecR
MLADTLPKIPSIGKRDKLQRVVFTIIECSSCHAKTKQAFKEGDYIVKEMGKCEKCGGPKAVSLIYSEKSARPK